MKTDFTQQQPSEAADSRMRMQQKIKRRKRERMIKGMKAAGLTLLIVGLVILAAFGIRKLVIEPYFPLQSGNQELPTGEPEALSQPQEQPPETPEDRQEQAELPPEPQPQEQPTDTEPAQQPDEQPPVSEEQPQPEEQPVTYALETEHTQQLDLQLYSSSAILIDLSSNTVLAEKNADALIYPASMTKIMTALVACEAITDWDATYTMTQDIIDTYFLADATMAGFLAGEAVSMTDLVYGAVLPSGAEATYALADVIADSEEAFAERMNEKAQELGLQATHFVNASGLHDEQHYTTVRDMAVLLQAALQNDRCREVLSTARYTSTPTQQNPDGVDMVNKFLVRAETQELSGASILAAKTGYTAQAMNCCASYGTMPDGRQCICVTANAWTSWYALYDHIAMYTTYCNET